MKQGGLKGFRLPAGAPPSGSFDELTLDPNRKYHVTLVLPQILDFVASCVVSRPASHARLFYPVAPTEARAQFPYASVSYANVCRAFATRGTLYGVLYRLQSEYQGTYRATLFCRTYLAKHLWRHEGQNPRLEVGVLRIAKRPRNPYLVCLSLSSAKSPPNKTPSRTEYLDAQSCTPYLTHQPVLLTTRVIEVGSTVF